MKRMDFLALDATVPQEKDPSAVILNFAGFTNDQANRIRVEAFDSIDDMGIQILEDQDKKELAKDFSRFLETTRISFGIAYPKRLIRMINWVQDHEFVPLTTSFTVGTTQLELMDILFKVLECENFRSAATKQAKAAHA